MYLNRTSQLIELLSNLDKIKPDIKKAFNLIKEVSKNGGIIYACGNGGAAALSDHFCEELTGKYDKVRPPIKAISFTNPGVITCIANDFKYKNVFARQIECFCSEKDVLVIFTTSGNSKNLIYAVQAGLAKKVPIIVFSGKGGGIINETYKDFVSQIIINSDKSSLIQEIHLNLLHSLVEELESDK